MGKQSPSRQLSESDGRGSLEVPHMPSGTDRVVGGGEFCLSNGSSARQGDVMDTPNLFDALFSFHPRNDHNPKENFLTEAFAYLLRTDDGVRDRWLSTLLKRAVEGATASILTQRMEQDQAGDSLICDLWISAQLGDGESVQIYCEHKWDSPCNNDQLQKYQRFAAREKAHLVFVGATSRQKSDAATCLPEDRCACFTWEDVYRALEGLSPKSTLLQEFLEFMKGQGLSHGKPLTIEGMTAFLRAADFRKSLLNLANKLLASYPWDVVPRRFHAKKYVHDAYGRVGIRFETKDWKPAITLGFLYDESDHRVTLVNRDNGIDLLLRIEASPNDTRSLNPHLRDVLDAKRSALQKEAASVLLKGERGNGNKYSLLIVRDCLGDVIRDRETQADQLTAIANKLARWLKILFEDGKLEEGFRKGGLHSGMARRRSENN